MTAALKKLHEDCWLSEPCSAGDPGTCPHEPIRRKRAAAQQGEWGALEVRREPGGLRHYLEGKPIHCGEGIELQAVEYKSDDYGDYHVPLQKGSVVRYEASWVGGELNVTLYGDIGGHEFAGRFAPWQRFRWPKKAWQR